MHDIYEKPIPCPWSYGWKVGTRVRKKSGSEWQGRVVGYYATELNPEGYAVLSEVHKNTVQIYPRKALELVEE